MTFYPYFLVREVRRFLVSFPYSRTLDVGLRTVVVASVREVTGTDILFLVLEVEVSVTLLAQT